MGKHLASGRYSGGREFDFGALQGKTVSVDGDSKIHETGGGALMLRMVATNVGASATVDLTVETSDDGVTFYPAGTFTQVTSTAGTQNQYKGFIVGRYTRVDYNIGGTGTADIALTGELH